MTPARAPRADPRTTRMLHLDPVSGVFADRRIGDLAGVLGPGDLLVLNDAATLPASLRGTTERGEAVEARLVGVEAPAGDGGEGAPAAAFTAILLGAGDWRQRTEDRPAPPRLAAGDAVRFTGITARVAVVDPETPRLVRLAFDRSGGDLWRALYRAGRPIQYSYLDRSLALWDVQTPFASRPWAAEAPSAGLALTWDLLLALRAKGVVLARVTHAAGPSSSGDAAVDARLPLAERSEVPEPTVRAVELARARGGRVVAAGTTVVRALESAAGADGVLRAGARAAGLRIGAATRLWVVDGLLTGMHEAGTSHFELLGAFAPRPLLDELNARAERLGYLAHEFGDSALILNGRGA